jgi:hypothetical protein
VVSESLRVLSYVYNLIVVAVERVHPAGPGSELLGLDALLAAADAAKALLQRSTDALAGCVAAPNTRSVGIQSLRWDDTGCLIMTEALGMAMARSHFDAAVASALVVLQGFLNSVGWLAFAFEVIRVVCLKIVSKLQRSELSGYNTYLSRPTLIIASWLPLKIGPLFIIENPTEAIRHTRWDVGNSFQWAMLSYGIHDVLSWCCPQCFLVGLANRFNGWILDVLVARDASGVIRTFMVVTSRPRCIEPIDNIGALEVLLSKMRGTVSNLFILTDCVKWPVRHVSRISLLKRSAACKSLAHCLEWCWVARSSSTALVQGSKGLRAVA